jgi:hypothetical protein
MGEAAMTPAPRAVKLRGGGGGVDEGVNKRG